VTGVPGRSALSTPAHISGSARTAVATPLRALFLGSGYAGHSTRFENLRGHIGDDPRLDSSWRLVTGWRHGGIVERIPGLPRGVKGRARAASELLPLLSWPRPDVIWSSAGSTDLALLAWSFGGPFDRPFVLDLDWTLDQREEFAPWYYGRPPRTGLFARMNRARESAVWRNVTMFTPWSEWAADALRRRGVEESRIHVLPPGVDVEYWKPEAERNALDEASPDRPLRLLFVGGDFRRKGGELLLEVMRSPLGERLQLDIVTREEVPSTPNVTVHRLNPNTPELRALYQRADLFILPSLAECFGIATIEAMATGLPVVVSDRGASREIVEHGRSGWLIEPTAQDLADRLSAILSNLSGLQGMGAQARATAVAHFNGVTNDARVADLLCDLSTRKLTNG